MRFSEIAVLATIPFEICAPNQLSALAREASGSDENVVYPDYRRDAAHVDVESVMYPDYRRSNNDESAVYPDYRRAVVDRNSDAAEGGAAKEDETVIYLDYRRGVN